MKYGSTVCTGLTAVPWRNAEVSRRDLGQVTGWTASDWSSRVIFIERCRLWTRWWIYTDNNHTEYRQCHSSAMTLQCSPVNDSDHATAVSFYCPQHIRYLAILHNQDMTTTTPVKSMDAEWCRLVPKTELVQHAVGCMFAVAWGKHCPLSPSTTQSPFCQS